MSNDPCNNEPCWQWIYKRAGVIAVIVYVVGCLAAAILQALTGS